MWLWLTLAACAPRCPDDLPPVDYADDASWICRPGRDDVCANPLRTWDVTRSPSVERDSVPDPDAPVDCFYVYPTMDLRLRLGVHDDLANLDDPIFATTAQAARFHEVCRVYVPAYRQVTLGTYTAPGRGEPCFDVAYDDISAAFDAFLAETGDRPFALVGHSQGGQIVSRLVRERVETDPALLDRLVVAMPIGWAIGTAAGSDVGGSFTTVPLCSEVQQTGCAVAYRSFLEGHQLPQQAAALAEGPDIACVNPPDAAAGDASATLAASVFPVARGFVQVPDDVPDDDDVFVSWTDSFTSRCVTDGVHTGLEIGWAGTGAEPLAKKGLITGINGSHLIDVQLALGDLVHGVEVRGRAWLDAHPEAE